MNCTDNTQSTCQHQAVIEIESVSSYEGSEGEADYAGGQGKNAPKECFIEILQTYQVSLLLL